MDMGPHVRVDSVDVAGFVAADGRIARTLGLQVLRSSRTECVTRVDAGPPLHNHVGGPHASVIFGAGELTAFGTMLERFHDLIALPDAVPLVKDSRIAYSGLVLGAFTATATLADDVEEGVRGSWAQRGVATFAVPVVFHRESDGVACAEAAYTMALKRL